MARAERNALIQRIEETRRSRVLVYATGDRFPAVAQIGDDAVRPLYDHLRGIGHVEKLDLFVYSRGGDIDVPWRIATALREASDEWHVLVPFRANSAATLLGLGADSIVLGRQGELGPIDPTMSIMRQIAQPGGPPIPVQDNLSVEDVMSFVKFVKERASLSDQAALTSALQRLTERLDAVSLGSAYRTHTHIREVARKMLLSRKEPPSEQAMATIVETLAERVYAHGHAIGFVDAQNIGLPVERPAPDLDEAMWQLLVEYEDAMKLRDPVDPIHAVSTAPTDTHAEEVITATIESGWGLHEHAGTLEVRARRQMPPNLNVAINVNVALPPQLDPQTLPQQAQQILAQLVQQAQAGVAQAAQEALQDALRDQAPIVNADVGVRGAAWRQVPA